MIEERYYWLGLYMISSSFGIGNYYYATAWFDGSGSTYSWWADRYPRFRYETCIVYTISGWQDVACDSEFYFATKKPAGE